MSESGSGAIFSLLWELKFTKNSLVSLESASCLSLEVENCSLMLEEMMGAKSAIFLF